ncbi:bifunctional DNA-formamidopyrimidine glycosylase/DNA-(apurinic or apyrimidinic site) lyase [Candidatus Woesearchaeota archaeon]|nr:bifunctional DNA-formamidopyrimidine glycosylase/DNA-(apurinic or apyrimidinic site) lyase [Candidatus Woesearchaeota archaeon]
MPELPEVETIVEQLKKRILGKNVVKVEVLDSIVDKPISKLTPFRIKNIYRRAKTLVFELDNGRYLFVHLRMTGHFHYLTAQQVASDKEKLVKVHRFLAAKFYFEDDGLLTYNDIRRFGFVKLFDKKQLEKELAKLGPEPLSEEFTLKMFIEMLSKKKNSVIKTLLMDQHFLAGLGNIYAQEVLYLAGIMPLRRTGTLSLEEIKELHRHIKELLELAIKHKGSTVDNYAHVDGSGNFQNYLVVYGRDKCPKGHVLKKIEIGGRGTSYCSECQK